MSNMYAFPGNFSASAKNLTLNAQTGSLDFDLVSADRDATQSVDSTSITYYIKATLDINSHLQLVHDSTTDGLDDAYGLDSFTVTSTTSGATFEYNIPGGSEDFDLGEVSVRDVNYSEDSGELTPNSGSNFQLAVTLQINANAGYEFSALLTGSDSLTYTTADVAEDLSKAHQVYWSHEANAPTVAADAADVLSLSITKAQATAQLSTELAAINTAEADSTAAGSIFQSWSIVVNEVDSEAADAVDNIVSKIARKNAADGLTLSTSSPVAFKQGDQLLVGNGIGADTLTVNVTGGTGGSLALGSENDTIYGIVIQS